MEETEVAAIAEGPERRLTPRLPVEGPASLLVLKHDYEVLCRVTDLSLGGCRIETQSSFVAGISVRVEVSFTVRGLVFRFNGVTQWTARQHLVGIRFVDVTARRREELAEILHEVEQQYAAKAAEQAAEKVAAEAQVAEALEEDAAPVEPELQAPALQVGDLTPQVEAEPGAGCASGDHAETGSCLAGSAGHGGSSPCGAAVASSQAPDMEPPKPVKLERRAQSRHEVDTSAAIYLIKIGSKIGGRIVDLSLGGCRIRAHERFPVGIYTRVEAEFRLEGLPFRLAGVIQAVHDQERLHVGIRFLNVSDRKREQVEQLIAEIEEMHKWQKHAG